MQEETENQLPVKFVRPQIIPIIPKNYEEIYKMGEMISKTEMVPKDYRGKPGNTIVAIQMGLEIGLMPIQAVQNIAVINGRPSLWGDAILALVQASGLLEWIEETIEETFSVCEVKRRGDSKIAKQKYSVQDAKTAQLWGKAGSWTTNPKRMMQMRARGFALRDKFADVLKGIQSAEEQNDIIDIGIVKESEAQKAANKEKADEVKARVEAEKPNLDALKDEGAETTTLGIASENAEPPEDDDIPLGKPLEEIDEPELITEEQGASFMNKARELKIPTKTVLKLVNDNGFSDISLITKEKIDLLMLGLDAKATK